MTEDRGQRTEDRRQVSNAQNDNGIDIMRIYDIRATSDERRITSRGFTLIELLVGLMVTSVILTAVAALAFAMGAANDTSRDTIEQQARLRYVTVRVGEILRYCKLVCGDPNDDLAVWVDDDNENELIDANELVYLVTGAGRDHLQLVEFSVLPAWFLSQTLAGQINYLKTSACRDDLILNWSDPAIELIPVCSNAMFRLDAVPPATEFVNMQFEMTEKGTTTKYEINAALRCRAGYLVD